MEFIRFINDLQIFYVLSGINYYKIFLMILTTYVIRASDGLILCEDYEKNDP